MAVRNFENNVASLAFWPELRLKVGSDSLSVLIIAGSVFV